MKISRTRRLHSNTARGTESESNPDPSGSFLGHTFREETIMALKQGEIYDCPNPDCGCQIQVTRSASASGSGNDNPRCCCGEEMQLRQTAQR